MKITLNLASRPFTDLTEVFKKLRVAMGVLVLVAALLGLTLHFVMQRAQRAYDRAHLLDKAVADLMKERQGYEAMMQQPANAKVVEETDSLNDLFDEKAFSWTLVMKDLETVLPGPVQITQIEPVRNIKDGQVILHIRVLGPRTQTIHLVENMEHSDRFRHPRIIGESPESEAGSNGKVQAVSASSAEDLDLLTDYNLALAVSDVPPPAAAPTSAATPAPAVPSAHKAKSSPSKPAGGPK
jgi:type IV pilus assembly protein PilN